VTEPGPSRQRLSSRDLCERSRLAYGPRFSVSREVLFRTVDSSSVRDLEFRLRTLSSQ